MKEMGIRREDAQDCKIWRMLIYGKVGQHGRTWKMATKTMIVMHASVERTFLPIVTIGVFCIFFVFIIAFHGINSYY